jgi:hypothetical protein
MRACSAANALQIARTRPEKASSDERGDPAQAVSAIVTETSSNVAVTVRKALSAVSPTRGTLRWQRVSPTSDFFGVSAMPPRWRRGEDRDLGLLGCRGRHVDRGRGVRGAQVAIAPARRPRRRSGPGSLARSPCRRRRLSGRQDSDRGTPDEQDVPGRVRQLPGTGAPARPRTPAAPTGARTGLDLRRARLVGSAQGQRLPVLERHRLRQPDPRRCDRLVASPQLSCPPLLAPLLAPASRSRASGVPSPPS